MADAKVIIFGIVIALIATALLGVVTYEVGNEVENRCLVDVEPTCDRGPGFPGEKGYCDTSICEVAWVQAPTAVQCVDAGCEWVEDRPDDYCYTYSEECDEAATNWRVVVAMGLGLLFLLGGIVFKRKESISIGTLLAGGIGITIGIVLLWSDLSPLLRIGVSVGAFVVVSVIGWYIFAGDD